jgi:hypothetical protein
MIIETRKGITVARLLIVINGISVAQLLIVGLQELSYSQ